MEEEEQQAGDGAQRGRNHQHLILPSAVEHNAHYEAHRDRREDEAQNEHTCRDRRTSNLEYDDYQAEKDRALRRLRQALGQPQTGEPPVREQCPRAHDFAYVGFVARILPLTAIVASHQTPTCGPRDTNRFTRFSKTLRASSTRRPQVWQTMPMSAPSRTTSHS